MPPDHLDIATPLVFVIFFFKLNEVQTETMHKFKILHNKNYMSVVVSLLLSKMRGGGVYLKFWALGGALIRRGPLF